MNANATLPLRRRQTIRTARWTLIASLFGLIILGVASVYARDSAAPVSIATRPALVQAVSRIGLTVEDMDRSLEFFTRVLDFEKVCDVEVAGKAYEQSTGVFGARSRIVRLKLGDEQIELTEFLVPHGREIPRDSRSNDLWFQHIAIITSDMTRAYRRLRANKVRHASSGPQVLPEWNKNAAGIRAFYFHDPDGHVLEILQFPAEKGADKWHAVDRLFLGIDHTAIVVKDTEQSLSFYRDVLGFKVVAQGENYGDEQEHLNNVLGAHLRITTLRPSAGPAAEFLEYLAPRDGRPYPADAKSNDLFHWQTTVVVTDLISLSRISNFRHPNDVAANPAPTTNPFLIRDPDGHAIQVTHESH